MNRTYRIFFISVAIAQAIVGVAFALRVPFIIQLWQAVLPGATPLSLTFVGSIFAAAGGATLWCLLVSNEEGALAGIALDYLVILIPVTLFAWQAVLTGSGGTPMVIFGIVTLIGVLLGFFTYRLSQKSPIRDPRPQPRFLRIAFFVFIVALVFVGTLMVLKQPQLPWPLSTEESVVYGWMFLGAAAYFVYAVVRPSWGNSSGQLAGFLAYDAILILPFLARFSSPIPPQFVFGHILYVLVVTFSGGLAIYYLFLNPRTRTTGYQAGEAISSAM